MRVRGLRKFGEELSDGATRGKPDIATPVAAFCAIGNPRSFVRQLESEGYDLAGSSIFPDHHRYDQRDVNRIVEKARRPERRV